MGRSCAGLAAPKHLLAPVGNIAVPPIDPPDQPMSLDPGSDDSLQLHRLHEGAFRLPGAWEDRSVTLLRPGGSEGLGASIVVTRDNLPDDMPLSGFVERQRRMFEKELPGFTLLQDTAGELDAHPSHLLEFHWDNRGVLLYQAVVIVLFERRLLNFTASVPRQAADRATRQSLLRIITSFRFVAPDAALPA